ncbi:FG-GAP repeat domain-containing protein [Actinoplanes friuliensis]|uniref:Peptidoglycan-binding protein n=1 Tax=Actinoplanes friuliensis DSM 7358 TaxID=1246995 RepID=U5W2K1_9ACTN|nr:VCBS repeat-containing protein [Actinoplanes friuliensis]AGZ43359.1 peptidoglycan-binding protein [Actinoplanes friuliensis DSM 7358]
MLPIVLRRVLITLVTTTVTAAGLAVGVSPAAAAPPTPSFGADIENWAPDDQADTCDPVNKPGTTAFMNLLNDTYGRHASAENISRACGGSRSEHHEGRALDYILNYNDSGQRADAEEIIAWLLATDRYGNQAANARRLGVMYIIWNRRIWSQARHTEGWRNYPCNGEPGDCHTNHVHFSFTWAGARQQTSWWSGVTHRPTGTVVDVSGDGFGDLLTVRADKTLWYYPNNIGRDGVPFQGDGVEVGRGFAKPGLISSADISGDGYADLLAVTADNKLAYYPNNIKRDGKPYGTPTVFGQGFADTTRILLADVSGDGFADLLTTTSNGRLHLFPNNIGRDNGIPFANSTPVGQGFAATAKLTAGDITGDGYAELLAATADGKLAYYPNNIKRDGTPYNTAVPIGEGWNAVSNLRLSDVTGDGYSDVLGVRTDGALSLYPNNIERDGIPFANSTPVGNRFTVVHLP